MFEKNEILHALNKSGFEYAIVDNTLTVGKLKIEFSAHKCKCWNGLQRLISHVYLLGEEVFSKDISIRKEVSYPWYFISVKKGKHILYKEIKMIQK